MYDLGLELDLREVVNVQIDRYSLAYIDIDIGWGDHIHQGVESLVGSYVTMRNRKNVENANISFSK